MSDSTQQIIEWLEQQKARIDDAIRLVKSLHWDNGENESKTIERLRKTPRSVVRIMRKIPVPEVSNEPRVKRKYTRKAKPVQTAEQAHEAVDQLLNGPQTMSAAMKQILGQLPKDQTFTLDDMREHLSRYKSEQWFIDADPTSVYQNLYYWSSTGLIEKIGQGALARYRVLKPEAFTPKAKDENAQD